MLKMFCREQAAHSDYDIILLYCSSSKCLYLHLVYVTGFDKTGLPHTQQHDTLLTITQQLYTLTDN